MPEPPALPESPQSIEAIARRAARRALAEHGERNPRSPRAIGARPPRRAGRGLVDAEALSRVQDGGALAVPHAALVTPLAREEAERRGIRLAEGAAGAERAPGARCVAVGCDHAGFALKGGVLAGLRELGARPIDFGARDARATDYPHPAQAVAEAVASGQCELGVVIDGTGIGSAIVANKVPGVRAAACTDEPMAASAREHNHANVLALGARWLAPAAADAILRTFLGTPSGGDRHARRVALITAVEQRYSRHGRGR
jgi:ribose 5-phosphate isomerase B